MDDQTPPETPVSIPTADDMLQRTKRKFREIVISGMAEAADQGRSYIALGSSTLEQELIDELSERGYTVEQNACNEQGPSAVISWDGPAMADIMSQVDRDPMVKMAKKIRGATPTDTEAKLS